jgi:exosortase family protein XrtF
MSNSVKFVLYFLLSFLVLNLVYQFILYNKANEIDPFTNVVAVFTANLYQLKYEPNPLKPGIQLLNNDVPIINIMEGCNGLAVWFTLVSFVVAFGGKKSLYFWFIPLSFLLLEAGNILRLLALIFIRIHHSSHFDFFHTYAFPAILYAFAFGLMLFWTKLQSGISKQNAQ